MLRWDDLGGGRGFKSATRPVLESPSSSWRPRRRRDGFLLNGAVGTSVLLDCFASKLDRYPCFDSTTSFEAACGIPYDGVEDNDVWYPLVDSYVVDDTEMEADESNVDNVLVDCVAVESSHLER